MSATSSPPTHWPSATSALPTSRPASPSPRRRTTRSRTSTAPPSIEPWATPTAPTHGCATESRIGAMTDTAPYNCLHEPAKSWTGLALPPHVGAARADLPRGGKAVGETPARADRDVEPRRQVDRAAPLADHIP